MLEIKEGIRFSNLESRFDTLEIKIYENSTLIKESSIAIKGLKEEKF